MGWSVTKNVVGALGVLIALGSPLVGYDVADADIRVYRDSRGVLYITNRPTRTAKNPGTLVTKTKQIDTVRRNDVAQRQTRSTDTASDFKGRLINVKQDLSQRRGGDRFVHDSLTTAPIHVYRNKQGTLLFTNVPNQPGYRPFLFLQPYVSRMTGKESADFDRLIRTACARYGVEFELVKAVIKAESAFNPWAISRAGARGLMQLMPETAADHGVADIHSPRQNIEGGVRHLRLLLERFEGNITLALAAYNAGAGAVGKYNGIPPYQETQQYVRKVLRFRESYRERSTLIRPPA
jgi:hypothetical protein